MHAQRVSAARVAETAYLILSGVRRRFERFSPPVRFLVSLLGHGHGRAKRKKAVARRWRGGARP